MSYLLILHYPLDYYYEQHCITQSLLRRTPNFTVELEPLEKLVTLGIVLAIFAYVIIQKVYIYVYTYVYIQLYIYIL